MRKRYHQGFPGTSGWRWVTTNCQVMVMFVITVNTNNNNWLRAQFLCRRYRASYRKHHTLGEKSERNYALHRLKQDWSQYRQCCGAGTQVVVPVHQFEKALPCYGIGIPPSIEKKPFGHEVNIWLYLREEINHANFVLQTPPWEHNGKLWNKCLNDIKA
jgi:hypothetical protein